MRFRATRPGTLGATLCLSALLTCGASRPADASYVGSVTAKDWDLLNPQEQTFTATTATPAAYAAQAGGNNAQSSSGAANGGWVSATSNSVVVQSPLGFDVSGQASATTRLDYRVQLVGPETPFVVPVRVVASGYVNSTGVGSGSLDFVVNYDAGGSSAQLLGNAAVSGTGSRVFSFDQVATFKTNAYFDVYLSVLASSGFIGAAGDGRSQAFLDPVFTINDPLYASLYHFEGVPGSVPEPASWVLAMLGLSVICGVRRGRSPAHSPR